ncbi:hypothetical protein CDL15_Pgr023433 [Punica granatum]|uniref:Uncharacterized protein n=1 Tax=Punica granatum TaxID=22663 RepID=A0A218XVM9_PUNGR|nr:hypothetical protein CDL15_Pgr023433 [Punica granatum]
MVHGTEVSTPHFGPLASHTRISDRGPGHYSSPGNLKQIGGRGVMSNRRRARSTEESRREQSEELTGGEPRKQRSWHCGTIHDRITKAPKGAQYGTLKIPLSAKVTNDTSECAPETSWLGRDTPMSHGRLF